MGWTSVPTSSEHNSSVRLWMFHPTVVGHCQMLSWWTKNDLNLSISEILSQAMHSVDQVPSYEHILTSLAPFPTEFAYFEHAIYSWGALHCPQSTSRMNNMLKSVNLEKPCQQWNMLIWWRFVYWMQLYHVCDYLKYYWNATDFSSTRITFDRVSIGEANNFGDEYGIGVMSWHQWRHKEGSPHWAWGVGLGVETRDQRNPNFKQLDSSLGPTKRMLNGFLKYFKIF